ncbi:MULTISPECIES: methyl-accepting chemotaxis protein [unclassified Pseudomonas]|uniref:methyl-accepting chemotaxis protein n=1 Tax=unclassified Pseudomonas TaxID=196821 RepID=UPI000D3B10B7|nr:MULTISPECIES: methyl-accepting chemotaxis protein [unclassified Pseudomonas]RAU43407.1 methyl-accepting chemotaxis protein [Pseudomonas sp. RIT 409]RAU50056.1 methyl-accepting chemotaxis protein [Pseudomonas sp. RIT 412]
MTLSIRSKVVVLCVAPALLLAFLIAGLSVTLLQKTADDQVNDTRNTLITSRKSALEHSVQVAQSAIAALYEASSPGDLTARDKAVSILKQLKYGTDGYYFGYDANSVRVFWADKDVKIGESFRDFRDPDGVPVINELVRVAQEGSHYQRYRFPIPNSDKVVPKIGYALYLAKWNLMIGTAVNLDDIDAQVAQVSAELKSRRSELVWQVLALSIVASVLLALLAAWQVKRLFSPLLQLRLQLDNIASGDGDLTHRLPIAAEDELGQLALAFNRFVDKIHRLIGHVAGMTYRLNTLVADVADQAQRSEKAMDLQRQETDQVATAIHEMSTAALQVAQNAQQAARAASQAQNEGASAGTVVNASVDSVNGLVENLTASGLSLTQLQTEVDAIAGVLAVIRAIAEQTNLLALNAAIEAARAGEAGRGFAVVADEVRALASRTQDSTKEIHGMIGRLEAGTVNTVTAMQQSSEAGGKTREQAVRAMTSLEAIASLISSINAMNAQIASAAEQQTAVSEEINRSVQQIAVSIDAVAQDTQRGADTARELSSLSADLEAAIKQFRI